MCASGWEGVRCETPVNWCRNVSCLNDGVCRSLTMDYECSCLGESYSGRHCEVVASRTRVLKTVSTSMVSVSIAMILSVVGFVVLMDILKYGFNMDIAKDDRRKIETKRRKRTRRSIQTVRYIYVNET